MNRLQAAFCVAFTTSLLALGACGVAPMGTATTAMATKLSDASEVPALMTDATSIVEAGLNSGTNVLTWKITSSGLSGSPTGAQFHGPAMAGENAAVAVPIGVGP